MKNIDILNIIQLYKQGFGVSEVADELHIDKNSTWSIIRAYHLSEFCEKLTLGYACVD